MEPYQPSTIQDVTALDILRYRYHHGTNLGSVYVLERWLFPSRFPEEAKGTSELAAVEAWVQKVGVDVTKTKFEKAWESAVSDDDVEWLKHEAKCTTIRLPIGYYNLPGSEFTRNTPFEPYAYIYSAAWPSIRTLISRLRAHSIGILLDLHALPGGTNSQDHSGTNTATASFFTSPSNRALGTRCCTFIAQEAASGLDIVGLQVVNEADCQSDGMYEWYNECIAAISAVDPSLPVIISDAWDLSTAIAYAQKKNTAYPSLPTCPVIVDTHLYWSFSTADKSKSPEDIIEEVPTIFSQLDRKEGSIIDRGAIQVIVGEYSNVFSEQSWVKAPGKPRQDLVTIFGFQQCRVYQQRAGGAFFWTWKMDWMPGGEWGFKAQTEARPLTGTRAITPPEYASIPCGDILALLQRALYCKDERMNIAVRQHEAYWEHLAPSRGSQHWRYENGWKVGYQDAYRVFEGQENHAVQRGNKIGWLELWVMKRIRESRFRGPHVWEFEQGLRRGIRDF